MINCRLESLEEITDVKPYSLIIIIVLIYICSIIFVYDYLYIKFPDIIMLIFIVLLIVTIVFLIFMLFQIKNIYDEKEVKRKQWEEEQKCDICTLLQHNKSSNMGFGFGLLILLILCKSIMENSKKTKSLFSGTNSIYTNIIFYYLLISIFVLFIGTQLASFAASILSPAVPWTFRTLSRLHCRDQR